LIYKVQLHETISIQRFALVSLLFLLFS